MAQCLAYWLSVPEAGAQLLAGTLFKVSWRAVPFRDCTTHTRVPDTRVLTWYPIPGYHGWVPGYQKSIHDLGILMGVVPCIEHAVAVEHVVLPYFVRPQVRQRLIGVSLTLYQPVDENSNVAPLRDAMTSHEKTSSLSVTT